MMRFVLLLLVAAGALITGPLLAGNKGYVLIAIGSYTIEMTVISACLLALMLYAALLVLEAILGRLFGLRSATRRWFTSRQHQKARIQQHNGLLALAEGDWARAEKLFQSSARRSDDTLESLLAAAEAANAQGATERRDAYLQQLVNDYPEAELAAGMLKARLQLRHGEKAAATATLEALRADYPKHDGLGKLLAESTLASGSATALETLLPQLPDPNDETLARNLPLYTQVIRAAAHDQAALHQRWQQLPKNWRQRPELLAEYARQLLQLQAEAAAAEALVDGLRKSAPIPLLEVIPGFTQPQPALLAALQRHPAGSSAALALATGWLLLLQRDYPQAQQCFEQAIAMQPDARAYQALARLMEQQRLFEKASEYYRLSLRQGTVS